jgi:TP901 family phage tail tape measure protein
LNNIQLNIVANAQFQQVYAEVARLKSALTSLQKASVGGPFTPAVTAEIKNAQAAFDSAVLSTRAFTVQHVAMSDSVTKFGKQLATGQLSLNNYYKIWRDSAKGVSAELDALATSQARLNRSVAIADPLRPGYAKLVTDINGVVTAEEKALFYQRALNTALQQGSMHLINFGKNTQWMGRQLTVGLTMPLAMFGAATSSAFLKFDQQMTSMLKVYGAHAVVQSQATLDTIRKQVTDLADKLARTLGVAMSDTVEIAKTFSSIGLEGQNLIKATEATVRLQKLGDLTAQQASTSMVSLQNVFKLQAGEISQAVDFLNAAKHSTSTTMQDIVDALPRVGPIIQQMGGTYKDFATLLVSLKESGIPAAQGANAIKSMLASIINPTKAAQTALKSLNIDLKGIVASNQGNVMGMVRGLQSALDALPQSQRLQAIEQIFGKFQFARVTALMNNLGKAGSQSAKVLELYGKSQTQLAAVAKQELDVASTGTAAARFQKMKATLQADLIPMGRTFLEAFTKIGSVVDKIIGAFKQLAKMMGPAAGLFGKIFGGGMAGLIVAGPIIMLTGLFANLIGNILRGVNSLRMFKQGMASASATENQFLAGLRGMRNFYEELDTSVIAARNQMDLMPEAITSNAKAFEILKTEIMSLTTQFQALAVAQREAMSMGGATSLLGTPMAPRGTSFLPIVPRNNGGSIPGFSNGGGIYNPSQHGSVVPGPSNVNYDSVLGSVPVGGFVLNKQASIRNSGLANLPRFAGGGNILAMLTPGEIVFDKATTQANQGLLNSVNSGYNIGGRVMAGKKGYGPSGPLGLEMSLFEMALRKNPTALSKSILAPYIESASIKGQAQAMHQLLGVPLSSGARFLEEGSMFGPAGSILTRQNKVITGMVAKPPTGLFGKEISSLVNEAGKAISVEKLNAIKAGAGLKGQAVDSYLGLLKEYGRTKGSPYIYGSTSHLLDSIYAKAPGIISPNELVMIKQQTSRRYEAEIRRMQNDGIPVTDNNDPYHLVSSSVMRDFTARNPHLNQVWAEWNTKHSAFNPIRLNEIAAGRGPSGIQDIIIHDPRTGGQILIPAMKGASGEGSLFFHSGNSSWTGQYGLSLPPFARGGKIQARATGGPVSSGQPYLVGENGPELFVPKNNGGIIPGFINGGGIKNFWNTGRFNPSEERLSAGRMGGMARMGTGMGLTMVAPMAINALPSKIGGTDVTAAKGALSSATSMAGMAMMFGASGPAALAIGGTMLAIKGATWAIGTLIKKHKEHLLTVQQTYSASTSAINMFNGALKQTPEALAINISQLKSDDPLKRVADHLKTLSGGSAIGTLNQFVAAQVVSGMDPKKVELMTKTLLTYTGQLDLIPGAIKEITKANSDLSTSTATYLQKLDIATKSSDGLATNYKKLSDGGKLYADSMYNVFNAIGSGSLKGESLVKVLTGIQKTTADAGVQFNMLKLGAEQAGDTKLTGLISSVEALVGSGSTAIGVLGRLQAMQASGIDGASFIAGNSKDLAAAANDPKKIKAAYDTLISSLKDQYAQQKKIDTPSTTTTSTTEKIKAIKQQIKDQTVIKRQLDDELKTMELQAKTIQQQNDYLNQQSDLTNQIKQAEITGNYITAAQLTNQQKQNTAKYNQQLGIDAQQAKVDAQQRVIDDLNSTLNDLQDTLNTVANAANGSSAASQALMNQIQQAQKDEATLLGKLPKIIQPQQLDGYNPYTDPKKMRKTPNGNVEYQYPDGSRQTIQWNNTSMAPAGYKPKDSAYGTSSVPLYKGSTQTKAFKDLGLGNSGLLKDIGGNWNAFDSNRELIKNFAKQEKIGAGSYFTLTDAMNKTYEFLVKKDKNIEMIKDLKVNPGNTSMGSDGTTVGAAGIGVQTNTIYVNGTGDPNKVAELVVKKLAVGAAKSNTTNKVGKP